MPAPTIYVIAGLSPLKPEAVAFKAGRLLLSEFNELIGRRETFALESTLSGRSYVEIFEEAKQRGYEIELHFVWKAQRTVDRIEDEADVAYLKRVREKELSFRPLDQYLANRAKRGQG
jgi:predicted ABC-type ATPase